MALGKKTGGRRPGSVNKRTLDVQQKLEALNCDPISAMARLAIKAEADGDLPLAARMYTELAPYLSPKKRSVEVTNADDWDRFSRAELESQYKAVLRKEVRQFQALPDAEKAEYLEH